MSTEFTRGKFKVAVRTYHPTPDLVALAVSNGGTITVRQAAQVMFGQEVPTKSQKNRIRAKLISLERAGKLILTDKGDAVTCRPAVWTIPNNNE